MLERNPKITEPADTVQADKIDQCLERLFLIDQPVPTYWEQIDQVKLELGLSTERFVQILSNAVEGIDNPSKLQVTNIIRIAYWLYERDIALANASHQYLHVASDKLDKCGLNEESHVLDLVEFTQTRIQCGDYYDWVEGAKIKLPEDKQKDPLETFDKSYFLIKEALPIDIKILSLVRFYENLDVGSLSKSSRDKKQGLATSVIIELGKLVNTPEGKAIHPELNYQVLRNMSKYHLVWGQKELALKYADKAFLDLKRYANGVDKNLKNLLLVAKTSQLYSHLKLGQLEEVDFDLEYIRSEFSACKGEAVIPRVDTNLAIPHTIPANTLLRTTIGLMPTKEELSNILFSEDSVDFVTQSYDLVADILPQSYARSLLYTLRQVVDLLKEPQLAQGDSNKTLKRELHLPKLANLTRNLIDVFNSENKIDNYRIFKEIYQLSLSLFDRHSKDPRSAQNFGCNMRLMLAYVQASMAKSLCNTKHAQGERFLENAVDTYLVTLEEIASDLTSIKSFKSRELFIAVTGDLIEQIGRYEDFDARYGFERKREKDSVSYDIKLHVPAILETLGKLEWPGLRASQYRIISESLVFYYDGDSTLRFNLDKFKSCRFISEKLKTLILAEKDEQEQVLLAASFINNIKEEIKVLRRLGAKHAWPAAMAEERKSLSFGKNALSQFPQSLKDELKEHTKKQKTYALHMWLEQLAARS